jgi:hypothetical protein
VRLWRHGVHLGCGWNGRNVEDMVWIVKPRAA